MEYVDYGDEDCTHMICYKNPYLKSLVNKMLEGTAVRFHEAENLGRAMHVILLKAMTCIVNNISIQPYLWCNICIVCLILFQICGLSIHNSLESFHTY